MKRLALQHMVFAMLLAFAAVDSSKVHARAAPWQKKPHDTTLKPREQPGGFLFNDALGIYVTIEGVLYDGGGKIESTFVLD